MKIKTSKCFNGKLYLTVEKYSYYRFCSCETLDILVKKLFTIPFVNKSIVILNAGSHATCTLNSTNLTVVGNTEANCSWQVIEFH